MLIDDLQRSAFNYFREFTNHENGLVADTSKPDWPCSIAAVGFALSCYSVGVTRGWLSRADASAIVAITLRFLDDAQAREVENTSHRGFFYHFLDMQTGRRAWNSEVSTIDTAILMAGVLSAAAFFDGADPVEDEIRSRAAKLVSRVDWQWVETRANRVRMGWTPEGGFMRRTWRGYSEALLMFILGMGSDTSPLSPDAYEAWLDTCDWLGGPDDGYLYAGPLFTHLFPQAWLDLRGLQDSLTRRDGIDYFENTRRAILRHRAYAVHNPAHFAGYGENLWGLTACDGPKKRLTLRNGRRQTIGGYVARGAPFGPDDGTIAPWIMPACLPFTSREAASGLRHLLATYPEVVRSGRFQDGFNPSIRAARAEGWVADRCTGLDQGLLVMTIENYRTGMCWELLRGSPIIRRGLQAGGFRGAWLGQRQSFA
jgi:hypothetical protein